ncbi:MAG: GNAT family N-acetyltransferase [Leptolyngbya sp. SIO3F4]|nr:GNAT family N-acetyltransferase [Leptolyngbya sp. SIO3F4]
MTRSELDIAIAWAASEGWNPGLHDADCFYGADPTGFLMGFLKGEPIASISAVKYGESFGFIGFYIVKPDFRGQGYGLEIWKAALDYLQGRNVGLDGVVAQQDNYIKSRFQLAHRNIRYEGVGNGVTYDSACMPLANIPIDLVLEYDRRFFPEERSGFMGCWTTQPGHHAVGVMQEKALLGYGVLRPCQSGYKIGPLFADTTAIAKDIFQTLIAKVPAGSRFYLDVPQLNKAALSMAEEQGMSYVFETARMYTQRAPGLPLDQIFGITTFELG